MKNLEVLLVDDDENHLFLIKEKLNSIQVYNVTSKKSFNEGSEFLDCNSPDIILIDYYLDNRKTAIDFIKENLMNKNIPVIILSTFYDDSILSKIQKVKPSDFLSKSCSEFELKKSIILSLVKSEETEKREVLNEYIFVKIGNIMKKVCLRQIEMIEVDGKYLNLNIDNRVYVIRSTLNDFIKKLPSNFIKIHQSFIVNLDFVEQVNLIDQKIQLKNVEAIYSKNYKKAILNSSYLK